MSVRRFSVALLGLLALGASACGAATRAASAPSGSATSTTAAATTTMSTVTTATLAAATTTTVAPTTTTTAAPTTTTSSGPKTDFGDGDWLVGQQVKPGTYVTTGGSLCYWERQKNLSGNFGAILANANIVGPDIVTILSTDKGFKTQGCGTWKPLPSSGPKATSFGDGVYAVNVEIAPGTYQTSGGGTCYWATLRNFTGDGVNSIIANDNVSGPTTVTVAAGDAGFDTQGCGTWHKVG